MPNKRAGGLTGVLAMVIPLLLCSALLAHPWHNQRPAIPLPVWHFADGRTLSAYLMKAEDGKVWFVDASGQTQVVAVNDLDDAGQKTVQGTASRLKILNTDPAAIQASAPAAAAVVLADVPAIDKSMPETAMAFQAFKHVKTHWDQSYLYVESNGVPEHQMMVGIKSWQQQVPLPQDYFGDNAWRIPLVPVVAESPAMIKGRFLRGAIALAVNGIPIFNPQNNRGEISQEIGELDQWGGHCGRADDYHYHIAPLHLQKIAGKGMPIAYALDGYPIYGLTEPDGSPIGKLDACNGHTTSIGYHYHAAMKYPYVIGGFHGQVVERNGQVDPQPRTDPIRPAGKPLRGATITDFKSVGTDQNELTYEIGGQKGSVTYGPSLAGGYRFSFQDTQGNKQEQTYQPRHGGAPVNRDDAKPVAGVLDSRDQSNESTFKLKSSAVVDGGQLPREFTGDGQSATLPLEWSGAPAGTKCYALIMHHIPGPGDVKWYWILYNIPAGVVSLPENVKGVGILGNNSVNGKAEYAPPHSKGPGPKTYILTIYALSAPPELKVPPAQVDRETLLAAIKDRTLGSAELKVIYDRTAVIQAGGRTDQTENVRPGGPGLIPREAEEKMGLTDDQRKEIAALEKDVNASLEKILTPDQLKMLKASHPPPPPGGPGGPGEDQNPPPPQN